MKSKSHEELKSYEKLTSQSVQQLLKVQKITLGAEARDASKGIATIFNLPFEPVWYVPVMVLGAIYTMLILHEAAPQLQSYSYESVKVFYHSFDFLYFIDVALMIGYKYFHVVDAPILRPTVRPKFILILELISVLPTELLYKGSSDPVEAEQKRAYYRLNRTLRIPRMFYYLYYKHSMVTMSVQLQVIFLYFITGLCTTISYNVTYNIKCLCINCNKNADYAFFLFQAALATSTNHGFGMMSDEVAWEIANTIAGYIISIVFGLTIGLTIICFTRAEAYKYIFKNNIKVINKQFQSIQTPKKIVEAAIEFYSIFWQKRGGFNADISFFSVIPFPMYEEVALDVCWIPLKHSKLFKNMDKAFLRYISTQVKQQFMLEGELIYHKGHIKHQMVYISTGIIQIISEQDGETPIMSLSAGTCLGESSLLISYNSRNTVRCKGYCEVHTLDKKDFIQAIGKYPERYRILRQSISNRYKHAKRVYKLSKYFNTTSEVEGQDYFTITWIKNTLHKLMAKDDDEKLRHEYQNIYLRYEMHEHKIHSMLFTAMYLDMLVITERQELEADTIFLKSTWPIVLQPDSLFLKVWEGIVVIVAIFAAFIIPYYSLLNKKIPMYGYFLFNTITAIWIIDFTLQLFTAVKTKDEVIYTIKGIFSKRLHSVGFVMDVISWVPFELYSGILVTAMDDRTYAMLNLNRILKIWRLQAVFKKWEDNLNSDMVRIGYLKFLFYILGLAYLNTTLLFAANCFRGLCDYYDNYSGFFPAVQIATGVGLVSEYDYQYNNNIMSSLCIYLAYACTSLMYVYFSTAYILENYDLLKIQKHAIDFLNIIKTKNIKRESGERIFNYMNTLWLSNTSHKILRKQSITVDMPRHLFQAMQEAAYADLLKNIPFFEGLSDYIITDISTIAVESYLPPNEVVTYAGDICEEILIIARGYCCAGVEKKILMPGDIINAFESTFGLPGLQTVMTITHCKILTIRYNQMKQIYAKHQSFQTEINETIKRCKYLVPRAKETLARTPTIRWRYNDERRGSFFHFSSWIEKNSLEEYEYYIPFDHVYVFSWVRFVLMRATIFPNGAFIYYWEILRCICAILSSIFFTMTTTGTCSYKYCYSAYFLMALDLLAWIDLYVRLHVCYYNEYGILVVHPLYTAKYYLTHGFLIDFLAAFPTHLFSGYRSSAERATRIVFFQSNRCLQIHRYIQLKNLLYYDKLLPYTNIFVFGYIPLLIVLSCIGSTLVLNLSCHFHQSIKASVNFTEGVICDEKSWLAQSKFSKPISPMMIELYGIYLTVSVITVTGVQGFVLNSYNLGLSTTILSLCGLFITTYVMCNIVSHYSSSSPALLAYQSAMENLKTFMRVKKVSPGLQDQIIAHYELKWKREKGKNISQLTGRFTYPMRQDLLYDLYGETLVNNTGFRSDSRQFYRNIIMDTRHTSFLKDSYIIRVNDITKHLHILYTGVVEITASDGTSLASITVGSMFGNLDGYHHTRQRVNALARGHVELLSIHSSTFHNVLDKYPELRLQFRQMSVVNMFFFPGKTKYGPFFSHEANTMRWPCLPRTVFDPNSKKVQAIQWFSLHSSCFTALLLESYQFALEEFGYYFIVVQVFADIFYIFYIFIKYHLAYEDDTGDLITDVSKVRKYRIKDSQSKSRVYLDVLSLIPLDWIAWLFPMELELKNDLLKYLRINRLIRMLNILEYFAHNRKLLAINHTWNQIEFIIVWTMLMIHTSACALIALCCSVPGNMIPEVKCSLEESSIEKLNTYLASLYICMNIFTRAGQDKFLPDTWQLTLFMITMMLGMMIAASIFLSQMFLTIYKTFFTKFKFARKMEQMNHFLRREEVSNILCQRVDVYIQRLWMRHNGVLFPYLLEKAPKYLREAILNASYAEHIHIHPVFTRTHADFQRQIVGHLRDNIYFPGDYIAFEDDINQCMFFIHRGEVVAVAEDDTKREIAFRTYKQGQVFGILQGLEPGIPYKYSYRAARLSVVLSLYYNWWKYLLEFYPASREIIEETVRDYKNRFNITN